MTLYEFYGQECPHCKDMIPLIKKIEKELNVKITQLEVWHNKENAKLLKELTGESCEFVPRFFNIKTKKMICGPATYQELKQWAKEN